jgi:hypothetical protein
MACTDRGLKPLSRTELAQQSLDVRMQCLARTVPDEDSPLEQADAQAALGARDRCLAAPGGLSAAKPIACGCFDEFREMLNPSYVARPRYGFQVMPSRSPFVLPVRLAFE